MSYLRGLRDQTGSPPIFVTREKSPNSNYGRIYFFIVDSYIQHELPPTIDQENIEYLNDLFEWLMEPCFDFIRHNCKQFLNTSELHLARSLMTTLTCLMDEIKMADQEGHDMNQATVSAQRPEICK